VVTDPHVELRRDADYTRQRLALYRAKVLSARPSSLARLRELELAHERAEARLAHAIRSTEETA
jgi:hypothetical protein